MSSKPCDSRWLINYTRLLCVRRPQIQYEAEQQSAMGRNSALPASIAASLVLLNIPLQAFAATKVQFSNSPDCQDEHFIGDYTSSSPGSEDKACHASPAGTQAIYVASLDAGCTGAQPSPTPQQTTHTNPALTVRTYSDASCSSLKALSLVPGTCYVGDSSDPPNAGVSAIRIICGAADSNNPVPSALVSDADPVATVTGDASAGNPEIGTPLAPINATDPQYPGSTWTGSTDAEALGRPTGAAGGDDSATVTATGAPASNTAASVTATATAGETVDPIAATSRPVLGTGSGGASVNSTGSATWSHTLTPSFTTTTSIEYSTYTGDGRGNGNGGGGASTTRTPGQGMASGRSGGMEVAVMLGALVVGMGWRAWW